MATEIPATINVMNNPRGDSKSSAVKERAKVNAMNAVVDTLLPTSFVVSINEVSKTTHTPIRNIAPNKPAISSVLTPCTNVSRPVSFPADEIIPVKL